MIDWFEFFVNMTMFHAFLGVGDIMGQYWALALELLFYAICVALIAFYPLYWYWFQYSTTQTNPHIFIFMSIILTIFLSYWIHRFIEKPSIDFGRRNFSGNAIAEQQPATDELLM